MAAARLTESPVPAGLRLPFYYGWVTLCVAALAMVATLPGRTQGLGLITEPLLRDLGLSRTVYAEINLVATLLGSVACIGFGRLIDRFGSRLILTMVAAALGAVVVAMSRCTSLVSLAMAMTLTRALGQSALSVASLSVVPLWFHRRQPQAMATYSILLSVGFMIAFPTLGALISSMGWRNAWAGVGVCLLVGMAPIAGLLMRRNPDSCGLQLDGEAIPAMETDRAPVRDFRLGEVVRFSLFWVLALASALYGFVASGLSLFNESVLAERGFALGIYHTSLAVTALTGLVGNFIGGWLLGRMAATRLMAIAMGLLAAALWALPHLHSIAGVMAQAVVMGAAGGVVTVLFFSVWSRFFGRRHLGMIQGAAQTLTVIGSAVGPLWLAKIVEWTGSYATGFRILGLLVAATGIWAALSREPRANAVK